MDSKTISGQYPGRVYFIPLMVFIYSPALVALTVPTAPDGTRYKLIVRSLETQKAHAETRSVHGGKAYFDISKTLQFLMKRQTTDLLTGHELNALAGVEEFSITLADEEERTTFATWDIYAVHGAIDQTESFRAAPVAALAKPLRLWINFPQTVTLWRDSAGDYAVRLPDNDNVYYNGDQTFAAYEVDLMSLLGNSDLAQAGETLKKLRAGKPVTLSLTNLAAIYDIGIREEIDDFYVRLIPDLSEPREGTYLRWLHRDGSIGYWLFKNGSLATNIAASSSFTRFYAGNPQEPIYNEFHFLDGNPTHGDFSESRVLTLGTCASTDEEFDYLCGLAESPVVERYIEMSNGDWGWQRVNVVASNYTRSRKTATRKDSAFEISIQLPQRNTIKL